MSRIARIAGFLAVLAAVGVLYVLLSMDDPVPEPVAPVDSAAPTKRAVGPALSERPQQGGVYAGVVLDQDDQPVASAHVLLISYSTGAADMRLQGSGADPETIADVPVIGRNEEGGEAVTDRKGAFRIAADSQSVITRVLAYREGFFPAVTEVKRSRSDIVLHMARAGKVVGTVVDDQSGAPVAGARVDIYLQQKVDKVPDDTAGKAYPVIHRKQFSQSWLATLGHFTSKVLGPRVWGVQDSGSETLRLFTDANGHFEIAPLGNSVQLEFVITHPHYKWYDFDTDEGKHTPKRLVVEAGQTVERTFRMRRGFRVRGQVTDEQGNGLSDVFVKVQSISAYYRHWWYRDKWRSTRTDQKGFFEVDGLAQGSQSIILQHPTFKQKTISVKKVPADNLLIVAERFGAVHGRLEGVPAGTAGRRVLVLFEATDAHPQGPRQFRRTESLKRTNEFLVQRVPPGPYRMWIKLGKFSSQPQEIEVNSLTIAEATFDVGAGGAIALRVVDQDGGVVDPASVRLVALREGKERPLGTFVSREGEVDIEGVAVGAYKLRVRAPGRIQATTDRFEVRRDGRTNLGRVTLRRWAYVRFGQPVNAGERPVHIVKDLILEWRQGEGAWQRVRNAGMDVPVPPGELQVRARSGEMRFEERLSVAGGKTTTVKVVFATAR